MDLNLSRFKWCSSIKLLVCIAGYSIKFGFKEALPSAKLGKACGHDGLAAEHFIFAD